jgi:hypothetical protein
MIGGELADTNSGSISFSPDATSRFKRAFGVGNRNLKAYACAHCHHLQFAVEFRPGDLERHQSFEGRQPSVVERLSENEGGDT